MSKPHKFTEEQKKFLSDNISDRSYQDMTNIFNAAFGTHFEVKRISSALKRFGLANGRNTQFQKGSSAWNKGKKGVHYSPETEFQKGHLPHNWRPIGSERVTDGYRMKKVSEPNKWRFVHQLEWEKHNDPIPQGYTIIFADRNPLNCSIENLRLVSRAELLIINQHGLQKDDSDLTDAGIATAKLMAKMYQLNN